MDETNKPTMDSILRKGEEDLINILVSSGINCTTCQFFQPSFPEGFGECKMGWTNNAPISLCMRWRQKQEEHNGHR